MLRFYYNNYIVYYIYTLTYILTISYEFYYKKEFNNEMNITVYYLQLFYLFFIVIFKTMHLFHKFISKLHISIYFHKILSQLKPKNFHEILKFIFKSVEQVIIKKDEKIIKESNHQSVNNGPQFILNKRNITLIVIILIELLLLLSCLDLSQEMTCV